MKPKEFIKERKDGSLAIFNFDKPKGRGWYWNLSGNRNVRLDGVNLDKAKTLDKCLELITEKCGKLWTGQVVDLIMKVEKKEGSA